MAIKRTIYLLTKKLDVIIDYTYGSTLPPFQFSVADYDLAGTTVTAYNAGESKKLKKQVCELKGNVISFTPKGGFFELGDNGLQLRITKDGKDLFSFICLVRCHDSYDGDDAAEVEDNPTIVTQLLSVVGKLSAEVEELEAELRAHGIQQTPLFANSIKECTDTTKVYVLPDGCIYAYLYVEDDGYINRLPQAVGEDGKAYNGGKGWKANYRLNSSGAEAYYADVEVTGFIPVKLGDVIRLKNVILKDISSATYANQCYLAIYDETKTKLLSSVTSALYGSGTEHNGIEIDNEEDRNIILINTAEAYNKSNGTDYRNEQMAFFRFSAEEITENSIVTINQEIVGNEYTGEAGYMWTNTGHTFVPADYEERIVALEEEVHDLNNTAYEHNNRLKALEEVDTNGVQPYVATEADRVAKQVSDIQNENTVSFIMMSDLHNDDGSKVVEEALLHAGQAANLIAEKVHIDAGVILGDIIAGNAEEKAKAKNQFLEVHSFLKNSIPWLYMRGNHDRIPMGDEGELTNSQAYALIEKHSKDVIRPTDKARGCFYKDLEDAKIRIICLNTADTLGINVDTSLEASYQMNRISAVQLQWLCETMDLSGKDDAGKWKICLFGHHPLDYGLVSGFNESYVDEDGTTWTMCVRNAVTVIQAYLDGGSVNIPLDDVTVSYDFAGKNVAEIVCNVHGHVHNFSSGELGDTGVVRLAIPNALPGRENSNYPDYVQDVEYPKTSGTAKDTSFCVVTIDTVQRKIHAHCYGAGYDRELNY